eukprot:TRINITY_DN8232_c0_g1_i1.p1 TRINITY_DN8232_c0_g1~~TRINITY_DN8232_c0_g1_i1.p1  ORF type:complete len:682 (+),score=218.44 TRINITY_DN8232_c0_g1_i1:121-2166(+)
MATSNAADVAHPSLVGKLKRPSRLSVMYGVDEYRQELGMSKADSGSEPTTPTTEASALPETPRTLAEIAKLQAVVDQLTAADNSDCQEMLRDAEVGARRLSKAKELRRRSKASFLENLGLKEQPEDDDNFLADILEEDSDVEVAAVATGCSTFALGSDDSDMSDMSDSDGESIDSIEEEYDFDHDIIADLVRKHACSDKERLTEAFEMAMASAFESKLVEKVKRKMKKKVESAEDDSAPAADPASYDVEGYMTPPLNEDADVVEHKAVSPREVAKSLDEAAVKANRRRSSMAAMKTGTDPLAQAMRHAAQRHRKSVTARLSVGGGHGEEAGDGKMKEACRRHRQSLCKVAEVLEDAGVADNAKDAELDKKMAFVQKAMEDALRKHRQSIVRAVRELEEMPAPAKSAFSADAKEFTPQEPRTPTKKQLNADAATFTPQEEATTTPQSSLKQLSATAAAFTPQDLRASPSAKQLHAGAAEFTPQAARGSPAAKQFNAGASEFTPQAVSSNAWSPQAQATGWQAESSPAYDRIRQAMTSAFDHHCEHYGAHETSTMWDQGYGESSHWQETRALSGDTVYYPPADNSQAYEATAWRTEGDAAYDAHGNYEPSRMAAPEQAPSFGQAYTGSDGCIYYDKATDSYQQQAGHAHAGGHGYGQTCWSGGGEQGAYNGAAYRSQPWRLAA